MILSLLTRPRVLVPAAIVAAIVAALWWAYSSGRDDANDEHATELAISYKQTLEDMNNAEIPVDPSALDRRLCELAGLTGCDLRRDRD